MFNFTTGVKFGCTGCGKSYILHIVIPVTEDIFLTKLKLSDTTCIVDYMLDREISENISVIPYPYTIDDANEWLEDTLILEEESGVQKYFAIRNAGGEIIGVIGLHFNYGEATDKTEFGYWLGKKHRNKGIMTAVIAAFCKLAGEQYGFQMLEAYVFDFNRASMNILLKNGFTNTGESVKRTRRDGREVKAVRFEKMQTNHP